MKIEDIIEGLNTHIDSLRESMGVNAKGHLVLQKTFNSHTTFKAYKVCEIILWFIQGKQRHKVISISQIVKATTDQKEQAFECLYKQLYWGIFCLVRSVVYDQIIMGDYKKEDYEATEI